MGYLQSCVFVQCWPRISLVQCQENLSNVGGICSNWLLSKNKNHWEVTRCYSDDIRLDLLLNLLWHHWTVFFLTKCCLKPLRKYCIGFWSVQYCSRNIKTTLNRIVFNIVWSRKGSITQGFSCAKLGHSPQTTLHRKIIYKVVLISLGQHCTSKLALQWQLCNATDNWDNIS